MFTTHPVPTSLLIAATLTSGLAAGLLYGFACAVMPGLSHVGDAAFVSAMQSINSSIVNPLFLLTFLGAPLLTVGAIVGRLGTDIRTPWWPLVAALVLTVLSLLITATMNIPLNNTLDAAGSLDPAAVRDAFESRWVNWNIARTVASTAAFGCLAVALAL
jgi:uncharacterized membrane protein